MVLVQVLISEGERMIESAQTPLSTLHFVMPSLVFGLVYLMIILDRFPKVVVVLLGATALILMGVLTQAEAFAYVDFNVIFLLVGMMIIVNIMKQTGTFEWLAFYAARLSQGSGVNLMLSFAVITAVCSTLLDNVTTVIFMASITCALAERLKINPIPFLIAEVIASNVGGTATLIGDPPNIMIGSAARLTFNDFLIHVAPAILIIFPVTLATLYFYYRKELTLPLHASEELKRLPLTGIIKDRPLLIKSLVILGLVVLAFVFHHIFHQEVGTIAMAGAALLMSFENFEDVWDDVEWTTIFFFIGLFMLVGAVEKVGTIQLLSEWFFTVTQGDFAITTIALLWFSGILSAIIDNIPYTATMIPAIQNLGSYYETITPFWWALSLGACLGGNGTMIGATANVLVVDMAHRCGYPIRFLEFLKIGALVTVESLVISSGYLWLRYVLPLS